ncbi:ABC transporter ATP-binding protein [Novosphingobium profundi]|uniref:ABC transporter ATP-binding protein n=1 Tax=Novosphingobium profundi TaxID=1774954 RepID=UPI001CFD3D30|nr:ABC transporter ATP-binding protein [Novosphingobium profundi]
MVAERLGFRQAAVWLSEIVGPDSGYVNVGIVYTVAISLLSLATPISVQLLINSVARTALVAPLWILSGVLFALLLIVAGLSALRIYLLAIFERRIFARIVAEITVRAVHAQNPFFADENRGHLFNRYFDLAIVQKSVPSLVIGAFTIVLQGAVGLMVTSFYHPFFLAFNLVLVLACGGIWLLWRRGAITGAVGVSHAKHNAAHWLETVGASNGFYKSARHLNFAMDRSEAVTADYIRAHKKYFRYSFAQTLGFFLVYAFAGAALLAMGGNLILAGQLSIGQLVAAELILSGVFYGIYQLGWYLDTFYDLVASSEELSLIFAIPQERIDRSGTAPSDGAVQMRNVEIQGTKLNFALEAGAQVIAVAAPDVENHIAMLLKRHAHPARGLISIGGSEMGTFDMYLLRSAVTVLNRSSIVEVTIREYLALAQPQGIDGAAMMRVLETVGLSTRISSLPKGLDTQLAGSGSPLTTVEVMQLKLANALLSAPRVLLLSQLYDMMPTERLKASLEALRKEETTVLFFTGRPEAITPDAYYWMGANEQRRFDTRQGLTHHVAAQEVRS